MAETKRVRVRYQSTGHGLSLIIAPNEPAEVAGATDELVDRGPEQDLTSDHDNGYQDGVLNISDACITLEFPAPDGRPSVLAWDPSEVDWRSWSEAVPA